jgi:DNA gyrase subunit A
MVITVNGKIIRMHCDDIRSMGRNTQGVRIMRLNNDDTIAAVTKVVRDDDEEDENGVVGETPVAGPDTTVEEPPQTGELFEE